MLLALPTGEDILLYSDLACCQPLDNAGHLTFPGAVGELSVSKRREMRAKGGEREREREREGEIQSIQS